MTAKYSVTKEIFSKRLKDLMIANNETTYSIGEILNLSAATISRYTDGKMAPKITTIYSMANHFNVNPVWLMGYDVKKTLEINPKTTNLSKEEIELLENFNKLNDLGKKEAAKRISELTEISKYITYNELCSTKIVELPKKEKQIWEEQGKQHLMPIACHDDNLTDEEKDIMNERINEYIKKQQ